MTNIILLSICIALFLFLIEFTFSPTIFEYNRDNGQCIRKYKHFWQSSYNKRILCNNQKIKSARIEKRKCSMKGGHDYCVVIELMNGQDVWVFPEGTFSRRFCERLISKINIFLSSREIKLVLKNNNTFYCFLLFVIFLLLVLLS